MSVRSCKTGRSPVSIMEATGPRSNHPDSDQPRESVVIFKERLGWRLSTAPPTLIPAARLSLRLPSLSGSSISIPVAVGKLAVGEAEGITVWPAGVGSCGLVVQKGHNTHTKRRGQVGEGSDQTGWIAEGTGPSHPFYPDVQLTDDGHEIRVDRSQEYWLVEVATGFTR